MNLRFKIPDEHSNVGRIYIDKIAEDPLPSDYRAVEYLESSGTQYISCPALSMAGSGGNYIECKACESDDYSIFGWAFQTLNLTASDGKYRMYGYGTNQYTSDVSTGLSVPHVFKLDGSDFYIDNSLKNFFGTSPIGVAKDLYLFARNRNSSPNDIGGNVRIYYFKFGDFQNGSVNLLADMLPCVRISDGKPGMYDLVSRSFFTNSGSGEFTYPPDEVEPETGDQLYDSEGYALIDSEGALIYAKE